MAVKGRAYGLPKDAYDPLTDHADDAAAHHTWPLIDANIPSAIARDAEVTASFTAHEGAANPHSVYLLSSITHSHTGGAGFSAGVSNLGNTLGATGVTGTRLVLVGTNNVTLSQSTDANGGTVSISGPTTVAQSVQTLGVYALGNTTGQSSSSTHDARTLSVQGDGIVSAGWSAGVLRLSATTVAQTAQTLGIYALGNTTGQSSSSTRDARSLSFQGDGIVSVGLSNGTVRLSATVAAQTAESQSHGMSNLGNTLGTSGIASGAQVRLLLAGGNNITLSQSLNGASGTVTIIGPAAGGAFSAGVSNLGNTAGATGVSGTRMVLVGANNITLSQTTDANGNTVSMSVAAPGAGGFAAGISNLGNTAGSTGVTGTRIVLVGTNNVTLSQSTDANGATISISAPNPGGGAAVTLSGYNPYPDLEKFGGQIGNGTLNLDPQRFDANVQFDRVVIPLINTNSSNSSGSHTLSFWVGLYTRNASTLSLLASVSSSTALTHSGTAGSYSLYSGNRLFTIPSTQTLTAGDYWIGMVSRTTSGGTNGSYSNLILSNIASNFLGHFGSAHNTTMQLTLGQGVYTVTTAGMPASIGFNQIRGSDSAARRAPWVMFASSTV